MKLGDMTDEELEQAVIEAEKRTLRIVKLWVAILVVAIVAMLRGSL